MIEFANQYDDDCLFEGDLADEPAMFETESFDDFFAEGTSQFFSPERDRIMQSAYRLYYESARQAIRESSRPAWPRTGTTQYLRTLKSESLPQPTLEDPSRVATKLAEIIGSYSQALGIYSELPMTSQSAAVLDEPDTSEPTDAKLGHPDSRYHNGSKLLTIGPDCARLRPYLTTDAYEYTSPLESIELREMVMSSALAVLDDADTYTTIVGEDTSGRVPALIIGKALNMVRAIQGLEPARRVFVSGRIANDRVPAYTASDENDHALLITEYICTGSSVRNALAGLRNANFQHTSVLTLDQGAPDFIYPVENYYMGAKYTYTGRADSHLYNLPPRFKGVEKGPYAPHSNRVKLDVSQREDLVRSRHEYEHFAKEIVDVWKILHEDAERKAKS